MTIDTDPLLGAAPDAHLDAGIEQAETKGERTRRRLLELAIERFGTKGFKGTSVSEIARAAGLTQAASYAYFDNKEALFRAAVDADASGLIDDVTTQVLDTPIRQLIPSVIVYAVIALEQHPLAKRILAGHEPDEVPRLIGLDALQELSNLMRDALIDGQRRGEVRADLDAELTGSGIQALILGTLFTTVQSDGAAEERHILGVVEAFDLMVRPPA